MNTPPLLLGSTLVFWGWQTEMLIFGACMGLIAEAARVIPWRWDFSTKDFNRIADMCAILFFGVLVYQFMLEQSNSTVLEIMKLLPMPFFPLILCQVYSLAQGVDDSALFYSARSMRKKNPDLPRKTVAVTYPFLLVCIVAASAANVRSSWFYAAAFAVTAWGLWAVRPKNRSTLVWVGLVLLAGAWGFVMQAGLHDLHRMIERAAISWYANRHYHSDPYKAVTAIGDMGEIGQSSRIVLRVSGPDGKNAPRLLRGGLYNTHIDGTWIARKSEFRPISLGEKEGRWVFSEIPDKADQIQVSMYLKKGRGILYSPNGAYGADDLYVGEVEVSTLGAVKINDGPGLVNYKVHYGPCTDQIQEPSKMDLQVFDKDLKAIEKVLAGLRLENKSDILKADQILSFFRNNFKYSLRLRRGKKDMDPLEHFLLVSRKGHCEYFATAAALMLRASGVPARYATGFSVQESSAPGKWIIRSRHAHAWVLVYLNGQWVDMDPTPSVWAEMEGARASHFKGLYDAISWCWWRFSQWRWSEDEEGSVVDYLVWLLIPLGGFLAYRLLKKERVEKRRDRSVQGETLFDQGRDSEFYLVEQRIGQWGFERGDGENLRDWMDRLEYDLLTPEMIDRLRNIAAIHNQYRFKPGGVSENQRTRLRSLAQNWLNMYPDPPLINGGKEDP